MGAAPRLNPQVVLAACTSTWASTLVVRERVEDALGRAVPVPDVAVALRSLRRAGQVESRALGTNGKAWRRAALAP
jgi:predicted transcriptional regulator